MKTLVLAFVALLLGLISSACASAGDGPNTSATSRTTVTPEQAYWGGVLGQLRIERSEFALQALQAWARVENTKAQWNPLSTTLKKPGSSDFNSAGVKSYPDQATGIQATADTLLYSPSGSGSYYKAIRGMLSQESFNRQELQVALSKWSDNGPYLPGLLDQWAALWSEKVAKQVTPTPTATLTSQASPTPTARRGSGDPSRQTVIEAAKLYAEYDANLIAADSKYKGKTVSIPGILDSSIDGSYNRYYVRLDRVRCWISYPPRQSGPVEAFFHVVKGQSVVLTGVVTGMAGGIVELYQCAVVGRRDIHDEPIQAANSATQLYTEWKRDREIAAAIWARDRKIAAARYEGQVIAVTGEVADIGIRTHDMGGEGIISIPYVSIETGGDWDIVCLFPTALKPQLSALTKNQQIAVKGRFDSSGFPFQEDYYKPMLRDCTLITSTPVP